MSDPTRLPLRQAVTLALLGRLRAALAPVVVQRNRRAFVDASEAPVLNLLPGGHTAEIQDYGDVTYTMTPTIEGTVSAGTDDALDAALDDLYARAVAALAADPTLGGLCVQIAETALDVRVAPVEESAAPLAFFSLDVAVEFRTPDGEGVTLADLPPVTGVFGPAPSPSSGSYAATVVGDGVAASFTVRHGLGTTDVSVEVRDPQDGNARVASVDDLAPTPDTVVVQFAQPLPDGAPLRIIIKR